jgi:hypothetical protein
MHHYYYYPTLQAFVLREFHAVVRNGSQYGPLLVKREFVTGNEIPRIVAHRCVIEASIDVSKKQA